MTRPRLLRVMAGRWDHRVTVVVGGAGFGKSTLLAQAMAENHLAPRGLDVWVGLGPQDHHADRLPSLLRNALAGSDMPGPDSPTGPDDADVTGIADEVWRRAPHQVCLIFDDVQHLPSASAGAHWLSALIEALPANGHVVLVGRAEPPVALARVRSHGALQRLGERELRFTTEELADFAALRGVGLDRVGSMSTWPALAELVTTVGRDMAELYLWEEVLDRLGADRRKVLAVVCELGGADDELASAALGTPVNLRVALDGVPLISVGPGRWHVPHRLWADVPGLALGADEALQIRRRGVEGLLDRGSYDEAFALLQGAGLWELAPEMLRRACLDADRISAGQLDRWLSGSPPTVRDSPEGRLAAGLHAAFTAPRDAVEPLKEVAARSRANGDLDAELTAIAQLARLAWWRQDLAPLGVELGMRVVELEATGHPMARALSAFGRAIIADVYGVDDTVLEQLGTIEPGVLDAGWASMAEWLTGVVRLDLGDTATASAIVQSSTRWAPPGQSCVFDALRLRTLWALGRVDQVLVEIGAVVAAVRASGQASNLYMSLTNASVVLSHTGRVDEARRYLDEAAAHAPGSNNSKQAVRTAIAAASLHLAEGNEAEAARTVREAVNAHGLNRGVDRRGWRQTIPLSYVLVPEVRRQWNEVPLAGHLRIARQLAVAVVAARAGDAGVLRAMDVPELNVVRAALHYRFAAELAVGLAAVGRREGPALLDALGPKGRDAVRELAAARTRRSKQAGSLLTAVPGPPAYTTQIRVLGPLAIRRSDQGGDEVQDTGLRRRRLRGLLAYLITHRTTDRATITAALWPDLDEAAAANNLAVTLSYLGKLLEPARPRGEPPYFVRLDGPQVHLVTGDHLRIDRDEFDGRVAAAARAEADGAPSMSLQHNLAALDLYQGELFADLPHADWFVLDREHYRNRFVAAAVRAGQLLLARGDTERAELTALRALAADPWAEHAHAVVVDAALATGNRAAAHRHLQRCLDALAELGVAPSASTNELRRRVIQGD